MYADEGSILLIFVSLETHKLFVDHSHCQTIIIQPAPNDENFFKKIMGKKFMSNISTDLSHKRFGQN